MAAPGSASLTLTVNGAGFTSASVVKWNGSSLATTYVSRTKLTATVPAAKLGSATTAVVTVFNPAPRGGTSNLAFFTVTQPATAAFTRTDIPSVRDNIQLVTADFNGDGVLDLASASWDDSLTATFTGNADGTFQPYKSYALSSGDHSLALGDFNYDGVMDLAVGLRGSNRIGMLLGKIDGTFKQGTFYPGLSAPYSLAAGDLNGDGRLDLVAANETGKSASVFIGQYGGFKKRVDYAIGRSAISLVMGDFNHDGKLDLAVSTFDDDKVTVLLGKGDGTFKSPVTYATGSQPGYYVSTADLNGDGNLDLVIANYGGTGGNVSVLLGKGDGTFGTATSYSCGGNCISVVAADLNGDGILDLATANFDSATVSLLVGNGDGTFQAASTFPGVSGARGLTVGDFNRDGKLDLAVGNQGASSISIFLQNTTTPPPSGNIYVVDTDNSRAQIFDGNGTYLSQFDHGFDLPTDITIDPISKDVYVKDGNLNCHVDKFDPTGVWLFSFGACATSGIGPGIFDNTGSVATDASGNIWITSPDFYYMQKYDSSGNWLAIVCMANVGVPSCPQVTPFLVQPQGIELDSTGNIYVANDYPFANGNNIVKFDSSGNYLSNFGSAGSGNGQFSVPEGIQFDAAGNIYVADAGNSRIQKFDKNGNYLSQFGSLGSGNGQFVAPLALAFDSAGNIFVTDDGNDRVEKFDANGNYLSQFGSLGSGNGQFHTPYGIVIVK